MRRASDPRDIVYALASLTAEGGNNLPPNYGLKYKRFAKTLLPGICGKPTSLISFWSEESPVDIAIVVVRLASSNGRTILGSGI
jgi:hypothetical protein